MSRWSIQLTPVAMARRKQIPTDAMPISAPFFGIRLPKNRMSRNETAGMSGKIQAFRRNQLAFSVVLGPVATSPA